jgi:hypothetical protein
MSEEFQLGDTVTLQAKYYNSEDELVDADESPTVTILDARQRSVQTGLVATKTSTGTYRYNFQTVGLQKGTYFHKWSAKFSTLPDSKSGSFTLKDIVT